MQPAQPPFVPQPSPPAYPQPGLAALANQGGGLGSLVSELRAGLKTRIALIVLVLVLGGILAAVGVSQDNIALLAIAGVITLALALFIQFWQSGLLVRLYSHGISYRSRFGEKTIAWDRLQSYQLVVIDQSAMAGRQAGLIGMLIVRLFAKKNKLIKPQSVVLLSIEGTKVSLGSNLKGYDQMLDSLVPHLTERLFAQAKQAYDSGAVVPFGKKVSIQKGMGITVSGLFGKQNLLPMTELAGVGFERASLAIRKKDKASSWQDVPITNVPNVHVFVRLATLELRGPASDGLPLAWTV